MTLHRRLSLIAGLALALAAPALATNGLYLTGYGAETLGRGGVNVAISDRTLGLNSNPAGIAQLQGNHYTLGLALLAPQLQFENAANPPTDGEDRYFPLPAFAWVRSGKDTPWAFGVGFLAQGGMGATFNNLNTFFGTRDQTYTQVRFATISPTVAYSFGDDAALGATLNLGWADAAFRFFPNTSFFNAQNPAMSFPGVKMEDAGGLQTSLRVGGWWRPLPSFTLGAIYQTKTDSTFDNGKLQANFRNFPGLGQAVTYDAKMDGFTFAAQAGVGVGVRATNRLLLALDVKRYFWDDAIDTITVTGTNPDVAGAPARVELPFVFNWKDQWVVALGGEYKASDTTTLRAGYNWGESPVPDDTLTPLFP
ncbi:MAG TPA: outer membrane protein transport protein, partial [Thermoanaerobaculia bacterium]|nr:outer membrane protein transport protein [Thermoanaerobaculia bacterium]